MARRQLAATVDVLLEVTDSGGEITLSRLGASIEAIVPRRQLRESADAVGRADSTSPRGGAPSDPVVLCQRLCAAQS